jgi:hypothetical protein
MHVTNLPLVLTSLSFLIPLYAAVETQNVPTTVCWSALTCTSVLLHITKRPYHLHGPGNCIPVLYAMDMTVVYIAMGRALMDGWGGGPAGLLASSIVIAYAAIVFLGGQCWNTFVYSRVPEFSILSHASVHLLSSVGGAGVIYLRALKNGHETSQIQAPQ